MKKIIFLFLLTVSMIRTADSQNTEQSVGLRYSAVFGLGTEIVYQHGLTMDRRLELGFGFNSRYEYINDLRQDYNSWALTGLYHKVWKLNDETNWYAGGGGILGYWSSNQKYDSRYKNGVFLCAAGDAGIEYTFPAGIKFGLNARPELGLFNQGIGVNVGLSVSYCFR